MMCERVKKMQQQQSLEKYTAIKELIKAGELTEQALKHNRHYLAERRAKEKGLNPEESFREMETKRADYKQQVKIQYCWSTHALRKLMLLVKEHGKDY